MTATATAMNMSPPHEPRALRILLVDDERLAMRSLAGVLETLGAIELFRAASLEEARRVLEETVIHVAFIDLQLSTDMRNRDGFVLLQELRGRYQTVPVVVSGHQRVDDIREAVKAGAEDYVLKSEFEQRVPLIIQKLRERFEVQEELLDLRARGGSDSTLGLVGSSVVMQNLRALIRRVAAAPGSLPVLIQGPTGSGKELVAQALHKLGSHPAAPFFDLNCGALAEPLIEDQLFGHVRGAFTDAHSDREGYFSLVRKGTLFLDELAELTPPLQTKLLRVLETRHFRPVGPTAVEKPFEGRIVAATHVDLKEHERLKRFRMDLYHRLDVLIIRVPSLLEHLDDLPELVQHFASKHERPKHFTQAAIERLRRHSWPGNVRELRNAVARLSVLVDADTIDVDALERYLSLDGGAATERVLRDELEVLTRKLLALPIERKLDTLLKVLVLGAVEQARGNNTEAGRSLGRSRKFIERFLKKLSRRDEDPGSDDDDV